MTPPLSPATFAILAGVGVVSGTIDAIAGGGGLVMLPALIATGLPPQVVLGTNKLQSILGTTVAASRYHRARLFSIRENLPLAALSLIGAIVGALLIRRIDNHALALLVPLLLVGAALYTVLSPRMEDHPGTPRLSARGYAPVITGVGVYDGFFGPGAGQFYALSLVTFRGLGLTRATAIAKFANLASNLGSLIVFAPSGQVHWALGLVVASGAMTGAVIGSRLATLHGARVIRPLLVVVSLSLTAKLIWNWFAA